MKTFRFAIKFYLACFIVLIFGIFRFKKGFDWVSGWFEK